MRRLVLTLLCGLLVVPAAALASPKAVGDGVLELRAVYGTVTIGTILNPAHGALWGQMDKGTLVVVDPVQGDGSIFVSGYDTKRLVPLAGPDGTLYTGTNLHFRVTGGSYKLKFVGQSIDLTAVGYGTANLSGDPFAFDTGDYAVDSGKWISVPTFTSPKYSFPVHFGTPPSQLPTPAPTP